MGGPSTRRSLPSLAAFALSGALHGALFGSIILLGRAGYAQHSVSEPSAAVRFVGGTFEIEPLIGSTNADSEGESSNFSPQHTRSVPHAPDAVSPSRADPPPEQPVAPKQPQKASPAPTNPVLAAPPDAPPVPARPAKEPRTQASATEPVRDAGPRDKPTASPEERIAKALREKAAAGVGEAAGATKFGAAGMAATVSPLVKAFTRAVPKATRTDAAWLQLPIGYTGQVTVRLGLDAEGRLVSAVPVEREVPPHFRRLVERTRLLLQAGRFALRPKQMSAGTRVLKLRAEVRQQAARDDDPFAEPHDTYRLGSTQTAPWRAYFTFNSGRHVEIKIEED